MAKFSIAFCILLVASIACAKDSSEGEQRVSGTNACSASITYLLNKVLDSYEKVMASALSKETTDVATIWYNLAVKNLNALIKEVSDPATKMLVGGNAMTCSNDIAYRAYDAFHLSWNGLERLAEANAAQRERIEQDRINREGH